MSIASFTATPSANAVTLAWTETGTSDNPVLIQWMHAGSNAWTVLMRNGPASGSFTMSGFTSGTTIYFQISDDGGDTWTTVVATTPGNSPYVLAPTLVQVAFLSSPFLTAYVQDSTYVTLTHLTCSAIRYSITILNSDGSETPLPLFTNVNLPVGSGSGPIYDAVQGAAYSDPRWTYNPVGYNFGFVPDISAGSPFNSLDTTYRVYVTFTPTTGQIAMVCYPVTVTTPITASCLTNATPDLYARITDNAGALLTPSEVTGINAQIYVINSDESLTPLTNFSGVNAQQVLTFSGTPSGTFALICEGITTSSIQYSDDPMTLIENVNTALSTAGIGAAADELGVGTGTGTGTGLSGITLAIIFGIGTWATRPVGDVTPIVAETIGLGLTFNGGYCSSTLSGLTPSSGATFDLTFSASFPASGAGLSKCLLGNYLNDADGGFYAVLAPDNGFGFNIINGSGSRVTVAAYGLRDGVTRNYKIEWTGTALNLYINNSLVNTAALTSVLTATQPFYLGSCPYGVANGYNSDATIYGPVVASENGTPMLTWPLTDGPPSPTAVETINGYNLTLIGSVAWVFSGITCTNLPITGGLSFNGSGYYASTWTGIAPTTSLDVQFDIQVASLPPSYQEVLGNHSPTQGGFGFSIVATTGHINFAAQTNTAFPNVSSSVSVCDGVRHTIRGTWDGSMINIYVDGSLSGSVSCTAIADPSSVFGIATVLSSYSGFVGSVLGPVTISIDGTPAARYNLAEGSGTTAADSVGGHTLTAAGSGTTWVIAGPPTAGVYGYEVAPEPLTVAEVIFSPLVGANGSTPQWNTDNIGYNFAHTPDISVNPAFTVKGQAYLVAYSISVISGNPVNLCFQVTTQ